MFGTILGLLVFVLLTILFGRLTRKTWSAQHGYIKWAGVILGGLFTFMFVLLTVIGAVGTYKLYRHNTVSTSEVTVAGMPDQVARGEHIAQILCASCHSLNGDLPLSGGENLSEDAGLPLGDIYAPNITPAGDIKEMSDGEIFLLLRTGVNEEGRATAMASVVGTHALSDEDTLAVIAYLRQSPAVENETPEFKPTILMALLAGSGLIPMEMPANVNAVSAPPKAVTAEYGEYVMSYMDCKSCHGEKLDGNVPPPYPPAPDIRNYFSHWSKDDFFNVVHAYAKSAQPEDVMPWEDLLRLDDAELEALYLYLHEMTSK